MVLMFLLIVKVDDLRANYSRPTVALADITDCATQCFAGDCSTVPIV